jgi:CheY-like chemotaxis protein/anti-sigma regulatory factor (Ser/Thr protein kinase)
MSHILIVDDSEVERRLAGGLLRNGGFEIEYAEHGLEALQSIDRAPPDLVLTDLVMPQMDGLQLLRVVRRRHPELPIVVMTAFGNEATAVEALELGAASYIPKARRGVKLQDVVRRVLARADALRSQESLMSCLSELECIFELENDPALIEPMVTLVEKTLFGLPLRDPMTRVRMGVALEEALLNALYHGNLELSEEECAQAKQSGTLQRLVAQRRAQAPYRDRRITVHVMINREGARFVVRDRGHGFATGDLTSKDDVSVFENGRLRGVTLMQNLMDDVVFNEVGNEVTLVKRCETNP